ncbi:hypothetical protein OCU04_011700 [Sclerotinia nivalis]|uniref:Uncharacterized protein n=1 Tax=Sclerotinia nivalis TaxID=352851 RepID=A0A9X0DF14_9HELO|nr:hypothetical protein OCU04_011700 [Sclerotinia nivalis]
MSAHNSSSCASAPSSPPVLIASSFGSSSFSSTTTPQSPSPSPSPQYDATVVTAREVFPTINPSSPLALYAGIPSNWNHAGVL